MAQRREPIEDQGFDKKFNGQVTKAQAGPGGTFADLRNYGGGIFAGSLNTTSPISGAGYKSDSTTVTSGTAASVNTSFTETGFWRPTVALTVKSPTATTTVTAKIDADIPTSIVEDMGIYVQNYVASTGGSVAVDTTARKRSLPQTMSAELTPNETWEAAANILLRESMTAEYWDGSTTVEEAINYPIYGYGGGIDATVSAGANVAQTIFAGMGSPQALNWDSVKTFGEGI